MEFRKEKQGMSQEQRRLLKPFDLSNIRRTETQIKRVFRKIEMRNKVFDESKKRGGAMLFKKLVENRKVRERVQFGGKGGCAKHYSSGGIVKSRNAAQMVGQQHNLTETDVALAHSKTLSGGSALSGAGRKSQKSDSSNSVSYQIQQAYEVKVVHPDQMVSIDGHPQNGVQILMAEQGRDLEEALDLQAESSRKMLAEVVSHQRPFKTNSKDDRKKNQHLIEKEIDILNKQVGVAFKEVELRVDESESFNSSEGHAHPHNLSQQARATNKRRNNQSQLKKDRDVNEAMDIARQLCLENEEPRLKRQNQKNCKDLHINKQSQGTWFEELTNRQFKDHLRKPLVVREVQFLIFIIVSEENEKKKFGKVSRIQLANDLNQVLKLIDKKQFQQLRDRELSFDQVRAKVNEKYFNLKYKVLEDLKHKLIPSIYNASKDPQNEVYYRKVFNVKDDNYFVPLKEILAEKEPWQTNAKCLRSLFKDVKPNLNIEDDRNQNTKHRAEVLGEFRARAKSVSRSSYLDLPANYFKEQNAVLLAAEKVCWLLNKDERDYCQGMTEDDFKIENQFKRPESRTLIERIIKCLKLKTDAGNPHGTTEAQQKIAQTLKQMQLKLNQKYFPPHDAHLSTSEEEKMKQSQLQDKKDQEIMTQLQCIRLVQQEKMIARAEQLQQMREQGAGSLATGESAASLALSLESEPAGVLLNAAHQKLFERQDMMKQLNFLKGIGVLTNRFTTEQLIKHLQDQQEIEQTGGTEAASPDKQEGEGGPRCYRSKTKNYMKQSKRDTDHRATQLVLEATQFMKQMEEKRKHQERIEIMNSSKGTSNAQPGIQYSNTVFTTINKTSGAASENAPFLDIQNQEELMSKKYEQQEAQKEEQSPQQYSEYADGNMNSQSVTASQNRPMHNRYKTNEVESDRRRSGSRKLGTLHVQQSGSSQEQEYDSQAKQEVKSSTKTNSNTVAKLYENGKSTHHASQPGDKAEPEHQYISFRDPKMNAETKSIEAKKQSDSEELLRTLSKKGDDTNTQDYLLFQRKRISNDASNHNESVRSISKLDEIISHEITEMEIDRKKSISNSIKNSGNAANSIEKNSKANSKNLTISHEDFKKMVENEEKENIEDKDAFIESHGANTLRIDSLENTKKKYAQQAQMLRSTVEYKSKLQDRIQEPHDLDIDPNNFQQPKQQLNLQLQELQIQGLNIGRLEKILQMSQQTNSIEDFIKLKSKLSDEEIQKWDLFAQKNGLQDLQELIIMHKMYQKNQENKRSNYIITTNLKSRNGALLPAHYQTEEQATGTMVSNMLSGDGSQENMNNTQSRRPQFIPEYLDLYLDAEKDYLRKDSFKSDYRNFMSQNMEELIVPKKVHTRQESKRSSYQSNRLLHGSKAKKSLANNYSQTQEKSRNQVISAPYLTQQVSNAKTQALRPQSSQAFINPKFQLDARKHMSSSNLREQNMAFKKTRPGTAHLQTQLQREYIPSQLSVKHLISVTPLEDAQNQTCKASRDDGSKDQAVNSSQVKVLKVAIQNQPINQNTSSGVSRSLHQSRPVSQGKLVLFKQKPMRNIELKVANKNDLWRSQAHLASTGNLSQSKQQYTHIEQITVHSKALPSQSNLIPIAQRKKSILEARKQLMSQNTDASKKKKATQNEETIKSTADYGTSTHMSQKNLRNGKIEYKDFETRANSMIKITPASQASYVKRGVPACAQDKYFHLHNLLNRAHPNFQSLKSVSSENLRANVDDQIQHHLPSTAAYGSQPSFLNINAVSIQHTISKSQYHSRQYLRGYEDKGTGISPPKQSSKALIDERIPDGISKLIEDYQHNQSQQEQLQARRRQEEMEFHMQALSSLGKREQGLQTQDFDLLNASI